MNKNKSGHCRDGSGATFTSGITLLLSFGSSDSLEKNTSSFGGGAIHRPFSGLGSGVNMQYSKENRVEQ